MSMNSRRKEDNTVDVRNITYRCIFVNLQACCARVKSRHLRDVVILPLALFFLELKRDTTDGSALDPFHQVRCEARNLVSEALRGDNSL